MKLENIHKIDEDVDIDKKKNINDISQSTLNLKPLPYQFPSDLHRNLFIWKENYNVENKINSLNCKKCKNPLIISTHQMRKSDEGMNTIYECRICDTHKKTMD